MTTTTDPIPACEQAFAAWLARAILLALPIDAVPVRRDDLIHLVAISADVPLSLTTGDVMRGIMRAVKAGEIEWCGEEGKSLRRRAPISPALDASRLRAIADQNDARLVRAVGRIRASLVEDMGPGSNVEPYHIAHSAQRLALAEAELLGYRAAVADLLGTVPA
jgi:hypothetical protein